MIPYIKSGRFDMRKWFVFVIVLFLIACGCCKIGGKKEVLTKEGAKLVYIGKNAQGYNEYENPKDGAVLIYIPPGEFIMGSDRGDRDEAPQKLVYLDGFFIYKYEVTNEQFEKFVSETGYKTEAERNGGGWRLFKEGWERDSSADWRHPFGEKSGIEGQAKFPVVQISWNDAVEYCKWAGVRLPTEAEWEKSARGTHGRMYPWGNSPPVESGVEKCNYNVFMDINPGVGGPMPVGSFPEYPSPYGCMDVAGNVWEWCSDWYDKRYYAVAPLVNPQGPDSGIWKVVRGGSWFDNHWFIRTSFRHRFEPYKRLSVLGFRPAASPVEGE